MLQWHWPCVFASEITAHCHSSQMAGEFSESEEAKVRPSRSEQPMLLDLTRSQRCKIKQPHIPAGKPPQWAQDTIP